jgi:hypothetical protein
MHLASRRSRVSIPLLIVAGALVATAANAQAPHQRTGWMAGMAIGPSWGSWTYGPEQDLPYWPNVTGTTKVEDGYSPQLRFGRALSPHFMLGVEYQGWFIEAGTVERKLRNTLQNLAFALTIYPGNPADYSGGIFLKAGAGLGWARANVVELNEELEQQGHGESRTESGLGLMVGAGYEFRVFRTLAVGAGATFNYLSIDQNFFEDGSFFPAVLTLNWYWD